MRLPLVPLLFLIISCHVSGQGITKHGLNSSSGSDFVNKNGKTVNIPSLSRYGQELFMVNVTTSPIASVTSNSASGGGSIVNPYDIGVIACGLCWSTSPNPVISDFRTSEDPDATEFTSQLTRLIPSTTYYLRAYVTTDAGTAYGEEISFQTLPRTDPSECLIAWYPFNGNADEKTGMGTDGVVNGAVLTEDRFGNADSAYYFNGTNNSITIPGYLPVNNSFTISFWAYSEKASGTANIITDGSINIGGRDFLLNFRGNEIGIRADKGTPLNYEYSSPAGLKNLNLLNRWVHVAWVMNAGMSAIYLDGIKIADINIAGTNEGSHDDHITLGARHVWTNMDNFFQGKLDEFRIYNCNLQPDEINSIYSAEGPLLPALGTTFLSDTTSTSILVLSNILSDGGALITERGVCWSTSPNPSISDSRTLDGTGTGSFTSNVTGLLPGTTYYLRSYATNSAGTTYGSELSFQTLNTFPNCGTVTDIDGNTYNTVTIGAQCWLKENLKTTRYNDGTAIPLVTDGGEWAALSTPGYCWYNNDEAANKATYGALYNWHTVDINNNGNKNLCPTGWRVPSDDDWTILTNFLTDNGYGFDGSGDDIAKSMASNSGWTIDPTPGVIGNDQINNNSSGFTAVPSGNRDPISSNFSGLGWNNPMWSSTSFAWYRVLIYSTETMPRGSAEGSNGFAIRCVKDVANTLPTISTTEVSQITSTSSTSGGNILSDGGSVITARGVCWNTTGSPTTEDKRTLNGMGIGAYTSSITGLLPETSYYLRAYATNNAGTSYGNEISFSTCPDIDPISFNSNLTYGSVNDIDDNEYKTIIIGTQEWMAENLRTTRYNNGDTIPNITDDETWSSLSDGAYCWLNDNICYKPTYGAIYNWYAANNNLCPIGWHLPSNAEWSILNATLGGNEIAGGKLKEQGFSHWSEPNEGATNESGFSVLPTGGFRNGALFSTGEFASFWTSTEYPDNQAFYRSLRYQYSIEGYSWGYKSNGSNVRCLKGPIPPKPTVSTLWTRNIQSDQAEIISTISSELPINSRGVCWDTSTLPDLLDNKTTDGNGTGSFTSKLTGLEPNNTYFVRAYSMNDDGITYGNELTFTTTVALPTEGLAGYWPFNGNANDESGNGNNLTNNDNIPFVSDRFGADSKAVSFNGTSQYFSRFSPSLPSGNSNRTLSLWLYCTSHDDWRTIFAYGDFTAAGSCYSEYHLATAGVRYPAGFIFNGRCNDFSVENSYPLNTWNNLVLKWENTTLSMYLNGSLFHTRTLNVFNTVLNLLVMGGGLDASAHGNINRFFNGKIDDVRIYNRVLNEAEIQNLYHEGGW